MIYKPITAVWEITMACNMHCKHCGSACANPQDDELTTQEALNLCKELGELGFKYITISGGEPTTRSDWYLIAKGLKENGIIPTMITNGWLVDEEIVDKAIESKISTVAISIDGLEDTHDFIRRPGSFKRSMRAFEIMKRKGLHSSAITTINKKNINELDDMKELFIKKGVKAWQLQMGLPMGNLKENSDLVLNPESMDTIIDFGYKNLKDDRINIFFADCIGYYNAKEIEVRKAFSKNYMWQGCGAGKYSMGILCNGDILGCTSIRDKEFIEGNIRKTPLKEIWTSPESFKWNREMTKDKIEGFCGKCKYGDICLGGCSNTRLCMGKSIYEENKYCSYYIFMDKKRQEIKKIKDIKILFENARELAQKGQFQLSQLLLERIIELGKKDNEILNLYAYVNFMLKNYNIARKVNEEILENNSENVYANKGFGLTLCKLGEIEKGISYLKKSVELTDSNYMEPYHDCAITLIEYDRIDEAKEILKQAKSMSSSFFEENKKIYDKLNVS